MKHLEYLRPHLLYTEATNEASVWSISAPIYYTQRQLMKRLEYLRPHLLYTEATNEAPEVSPPPPIIHRGN